MKIPRLVVAMGYIDDDLVSEAVKYKPILRKRKWIYIITAAACTIVVLSTNFIFNIIKNPSLPSSAPAHFYFENKVYVYHGHTVKSLPDNFEFVGKVNNVGESFTGVDFDGNVDGCIYMNKTDRSIAYFQWDEWDESIDGQEPYLVLVLEK